MASKGEMWVFDSSCITQLQREITTDSIAHNCITQSPLSISEICLKVPLLATESPVAQWLEHPNRSRMVVGSNPIWVSDFSEFSVGSISNFISCISFSHFLTWVIIMMIYFYLYNGNRFYNTEQYNTIHYLQCYLLTMTIHYITYG